MGDAPPGAPPRLREAINFSYEHQRHAGFVGREALLDRLDRELTREAAQRWVVVTGGPGMGKKADHVPETIRHHVGLFRRIVGKARGHYQLPPIDWDLNTLPAVDNEPAVKNRLNAEQIATVLPIVVERYPFYAPMIFALYTLGLRYCHVAAMRSEKLTSDGVIALEETCDVSANVFSPVDQRKKAPPVIAMEPRTSSWSAGTSAT